MVSPKTKKVVYYVVLASAFQDCCKSCLARFFDDWRWEVLANQPDASSRDGRKMSLSNNPKSKNAEIPTRE